jgi:hypothetical protein
MHNWRPLGKATPVTSTRKSGTAGPAAGIGMRWTGRLDAFILIHPNEANRRDTGCVCAPGGRYSSVFPEHPHPVPLT